MKKNNINKLATSDPTRRDFLGRVILAGGVGSASTLLPVTTVAAQQSCPLTGSVAWTQPDNNNHVIALQEQDAGGDGSVLLEYFGHCAFKLTSPQGVTMMFDPWRNDPSGAWGLWFPNDFPKSKVDIGLSTHAHFDHDAIDRLDAVMLLDRMVGEYRFADISITGIADKHACSAPGWYQWTNAIKEFGADPCPPNNPGHMDMYMYVVETGGLRILMWGDNRHNPSPHVLRQLGNIDVLTLPVDGSQHILSYEQGNEIVAMLNPKIIIPTHYLCEGVSITLTTLESADTWIKSQKNHNMLSSGEILLHKNEVAAMNQEFMYFGANTKVPVA
jgi:L-ascorbate metabolism protein UlaG (beta-lactamase superfamily)